MYSDHTVHFPCISSKVNQYIMIVYCVNQNVIIYQPMKIRPETELVTANTTIHQKLVTHGFKPQINYLYTKYPKALKTFMTEVDEKFQLTTPHIYRVNAAKWEI